MNLIRGLHGGFRAAGVLGSAAIFIMMVFTTADVAGRYIFNRPIYWAFEVTEALLVVCVYLALAYTEMQEGHVNVNILVSHLSPRAQDIMFIVGRAAVLAFCVFLIWETWSIAQYSLRIHELAPTATKTPLGPGKLMVPIGIFLIAVELVIKIANRFRLLLSRSQTPICADANYITRQEA